MWCEKDKFAAFGGGTSMHVLHVQRWRLILVLAVCLIYPRLVIATDEPTLSQEQMRQFLLTAKVVKSQASKKGITQPWRLTLSDGTLTHDAAFQAIDEHRVMAKLGSGRNEAGFVDSYKYNLAAYTLAELLGLHDMMPVYVERKWRGDAGSLSWWLPVKMDEEERVKQRISAPDIHAWNQQMYRIRVFDQLVYDTDPNLTNFLISEDWHIWRIDFTRAFRLSDDLRSATDLIRCDRQLFEKLKALNGNELAEKTKRYLDKDQVKAVMARRDKIVTYFQKLISEKGENEVLY
jgi:hypothetical protein